MSWKRVVVGVDGSACSAHALRWAAEEARARGADLIVVTACTLPPVPAGAGYGSLPWVGQEAWRHEEEVRSRAEDMVRDTIRRTLGGRPGVTIAIEAVPGAPAPVLVESSKDADLLVVGSRGLGGFVGMLLGSVSHHVIQHACCPVVVVR